MKCSVLHGLALGALLLPSTGCSEPVPIPDAPGLILVDAFVGAPARPNPLPPKDVIPHPLLGVNSVFHEEHYNSARISDLIWTSRPPRGLQHLY